VRLFRRPSAEGLSSVCRFLPEAFGAMPKNFREEDRG